MERNHRNYEEGEVLRDLAVAGTKIKIITTTEAVVIAPIFNVDPLVLIGKKIIEISNKKPLGINRLGKVDFLLNFCKGYIGVTMSKK